MVCCGQDKLPILMNRFNNIQQNRQTFSTRRQEIQVNSLPPPSFQLEQNPILSNTTEKTGRFIKFIRNEKRVQEILEHQKLVEKLGLNRVITYKEKIKEEEVSTENSAKPTWDEKNSNIEHLNVILKQELKNL